MSKIKHTPTPWRIGPYGGIYQRSIDGFTVGPMIVSGLTKSGPLLNTKENEQFIVKAVNFYAEHIAVKATALPLIPTEEMVKAGEDNILGKEDVHAVWVAMAQAFLGGAE